MRRSAQQLARSNAILPPRLISVFCACVIVACCRNAEMRSPYGAFKRSEVGEMLRFAPVAHSPSVTSTHWPPCLISCHERTFAIRASLLLRDSSTRRLRSAALSPSVSMMIWSSPGRPTRAITSSKMFLTELPLMVCCFLPSDSP